MPTSILPEGVAELDVYPMNLQGQDWARIFTYIYSKVAEIAEIACNFPLPIFHPYWGRETPSHSPHNQF